jgi:hypothetical protein
VWMASPISTRCMSVGTVTRSSSTPSTCWQWMATIYAAYLSRCARPILQGFCAAGLTGCSWRRSNRGDRARPVPPGLQVRAGGVGVETARPALPWCSVAGLDQGQESDVAGDGAREGYRMVERAVKITAEQMRDMGVRPAGAAVPSTMRSYFKRSGHCTRCEDAFRSDAMAFMMRESVTMGRFTRRRRSGLSSRYV